MHQRSGDELLLQVQAGPHLELAADPERVDALIAGRRRCVCPDRLPVVLACACARCRGRVAVALQANQLESSIRVQISGSTHVETE